MKEKKHNRITLERYKIQASPRAVYKLASKNQVSLDSSIYHVKSAPEKLTSIYVNSQQVVGESLKPSISPQNSIDVSSIATTTTTTTIKQPEEIKQVSKVETIQSVKLSTNETIKETEKAKLETVKSSSSLSSDKTKKKAFHPPIFSSQLSLSQTTILPFDSSTVNQTVSLLYPSSHSEDFLLCITEDYNAIADLRDTILAIVSYCVVDKKVFGNEMGGVIRRVIKWCKKRNSSELVNAVNEFNSLLQEAIANKGLTPITASPLLINHILEQAYSRTVASHADLLSQKGFGSTVYGEIKTKLVSEFISLTNLTKSKTFLDLGSGIGNVVLQVAGVGCECYGIEIVEKTAKLAEHYRSEFIRRIRLYGKTCGKIKLIAGDFLDNEVIDSVIKTCDVIFVNKYFLLI